MSKWVALLRGINVSGQKKIHMSDLRSLFESKGFCNVETYIQSGNVIFSDPGKHPPDFLKNHIEKGIREKFGFEVCVLLITSSQLKEVIARNPFLDEPALDPEKMHITLLAVTPKESIADEKNYEIYLPDRFLRIQSTVYLYCPNGYGKTKLNNSFFERKFKTSATTRNIRSMVKILSLAESEN